MINTVTNQMHVINTTKICKILCTVHKIQVLVAKTTSGYEKILWQGTTSKNEIMHAYINLQ